MSWEGALPTMVHLSSLLRGSLVRGLVILGLVGCGGGGRSASTSVGGSGGEESGGSGGSSKTGGSTGTGGQADTGGSTGSTGGSTGTDTGGASGGGGSDVDGGVTPPEADAAPPDTGPAFPTAAIPEPWKDEDVGMVGLPGAAGRTTGRYHVMGSGGDIWGDADQFNFLHRPVSGDLELVAKVVSQQNTSADARAGIMLRESNAPDARNVFMTVFPATDKNGVLDGKGTRLTFRDKRIDMNTGYVDLGSLHPPAVDAAPLWLKIVRSKGLFTGYVSADGLAWTKDGEWTIAGMPGDLLAGLAVTAHSNTKTSAAEFEGLRITALTDATWAHDEVGTLGGLAAGSPNKFELQSAGAGLANKADGVTFVHQLAQHLGDLEITGRISALTSSGEKAARAGFMLRSGLEAGARMVAFVVDLSAKGQRYYIVRRSADDGNVSSTLDMRPGPDGGAPDVAPPADADPADAAAPMPTALEPVWLKLVRLDDRFVGFISTKKNPGNNDWVTVVDLRNFVVSQNAYLGVVATSSNQASGASATVEEVTVSAKPTTKLPPVDAGAPPDGM
jgi:hypothetical protein